MPTLMPVSFGNAAATRFAPRHLHAADDVELALRKRCDAPRDASQCDDDALHALLRTLVRVSTRLARDHSAALLRASAVPHNVARKRRVSVGCTGRSAPFGFFGTSLAPCPPQERDNKRGRAHGDSFASKSTGNFPGHRGNRRAAFFSDCGGGSLPLRGRRSCRVFRSAQCAGKGTTLKIAAEVSVSASARAVETRTGDEAKRIVAGMTSLQVLRIEGMSAERTRKKNSQGIREAWIYCRDDMYVDIELQVSP